MREGKRFRAPPLRDDTLHRFDGKRAKRQEDKSIKRDFSTIFSADECCRFRAVILEKPQNPRAENTACPSSSSTWRAVAIFLIASFSIIDIVHGIKTNLARKPKDRTIRLAFLRSVLDPVPTNIFHVTEIFPPVCSLSPVQYNWNNERSDKDLLTTRECVSATGVEKAAEGSRALSVCLR